MSLTPGLTLVGLLLVLIAIPLGLAFGPLVIGAIVLVYAARQAHDELADGPAHAPRLSAPSPMTTKERPPGTIAAGVVRC